MVNDEVEVKDFWREGGRHRGFGQTAGKLRLAPLDQKKKKKRKFVWRLPRESRLWPQRRSPNHSGFLFLISYYRDAVERLAKLTNVRRSRLPSLVPRHKPVGLGDTDETRTYFDYRPEPAFSLNNAFRS